MIEFTTTFDFSNSDSQNFIANLLISKTIEKLLIIIDQVRNETFKYDDYSLTKNKNSGLTKKTGIYVIINKRTKKIYLGGTGDLAQRKGEHKNNFTKVERSQKVYSSMREDLTEGNPNDFYFVPIVGFQQDLAIFTEKKELGLTNQESVKKQLSMFLDLKVEQVVLKQMLTNESLSGMYAKMFYNQKTIGVFQEGNTYGGTPESGAENRALCFKDYAWESVSAAANSLNKDRKSIRNKRDKGVLKEISSKEYNNFEGIKISNVESLNFFENDQNILTTLKNEIGFRL